MSSTSVMYEAERRPANPLSPGNTAERRPAGVVLLLHCFSVACIVSELLNAASEPKRGKEGDESWGNQGEI